MHVLILNQTFYPDVAATAQHMWDLARHLERQGHRVTALTSRNLYGTDRPAGPAYEKIGTIEIHRVGGTSFGKRGLAARVADFGSFYAAAGLKLQRLPVPDVIHALTSPPLIATLAMMQKQLRVGDAGRSPRFVYHVMDLYPDAAVASGIMREGSAIERMLRRVSGQTLRRADAVIALGRDMRDRILAGYRSYVPPERIHVIPPWADGRELYPIDRGHNPLADELNLRDTFNVVYSGNLGVAHDVDTIVQAINATSDSARLRWVFIGGGKGLRELEAQARHAHWPHVRVLPYQERSALNHSLNLADVHLVSQLPAFVGLVVPSKLFGIMAVGRPTIFVGSPEAECARILSEHGAGVVVANGDVSELLRQVRQMEANVNVRQRMGDHARAAFERCYDKRIAACRIEQVLTQACGCSRASCRQRDLD